MKDFEAMLSVIASLTDAELDAGQPLPLSLLKHREGSLSTYYAPFEHVADDARLAIIGITPGRQQAVNALRAARNALKGGVAPEAALATAKQAASFSGPMRNNLVRMLDSIGLATMLGIESSAHLFENGSGAAHFTSTLRFPVFVEGRNYSGSSPGLLASPYIVRQLEAQLPMELERVPEALIIPLGPVVRNALEHLGRRGLIDSSRIVPGLVHPSGANAERIACFLGTKATTALSVKTDPARILAGRAAAERFIEGRCAGRKLRPPRSQDIETTIIGECRLTPGNLRNNHFYIRPCVSAFPPESIGGSNRHTAGMPISVEWGGDEPALTDIDGEKMIFRARSWVGQFFSRNVARPGDIVVIARLATGHYQVQIRRERSEGETAS